MNYSHMLDTRHRCPGCHETTSAHHIACQPCWRRLPLDLQTRIHVTRWGGNDAGHADALRDCARWYATNPQKAQRFRIW